MAVLLSLDEECHVRLLPSAMTLIRWQPASHYCCKFLQDHVTLRGRCGSCGKAISRLRSSWQRGAGARKEGFTTLTLLPPIRKNSSQGLDRLETPCTRDSVHLLPTGTRFGLHCEYTKPLHPPQPQLPARPKINDPTKGFLIVSEVDKQRASEQAKVSAIRDHTRARTHGSQQERHTDLEFMASI